MNKKILILGASGNFGSKIAKTLAKADIEIILSGRRKDRLIDLKNEIMKTRPNLSIEIACFDINENIAEHLANLKPFIVINTCGPFQSADYSLVEICINLGIQYIDLADGRDFVSGISHAFNESAKAKECLVVSGASTVPCLSSAVLEQYKNEFSEITSLKYGIAPAQRTDRGLAITQALLSYTGKPLKSVSETSKTRYGWQDLYSQSYPDIGNRWMANCDIPDLDLFPTFYGIKNIQFSAGLESNFLHFTLWLLSWLVRFKFPINLEKHANLLLKLSHLFDRFGSYDGGMHMIITGKDKNGNNKTIKWFIIAKNSEGPFIPIAPAVILTKKLVQNKLDLRGAFACINLVSLDEYLSELEKNNISVYSEIKVDQSINGDLHEK